MIRDKKKFDQIWFNEVYEYYCKRVINKGSVLSNYGYHRDILLMKYVRGDRFEKISKYFEQFIQVASEYKNTQIQNGTTDTFDFSFLESDVYPILAFALAFPISDKTQSIIAEELFTEGKDCLTDRLIATWNCERKLTSYDAWKVTAPTHSKVFNILYKSIDTPKSEQPALIQDHLKNWHKKKWRQDVSLGSDPDYPKERPRYYGQFAYEVAAVVMAFDIDDSSFREDIYYPKELVEYFRENH